MPWPCESLFFSHIEQSVGVSVKETSIEIRMAAAEVIPKLKKYRPTWPVMNATGRKITQSDSVVAITARPISSVALMAASCGVTPFSST